jgi:hypothetical protein
MTRFRIGAAVLLLALGAIAFLETGSAPTASEDIPPTHVRWVGDDGLERIGIDFD